MIGRRDPVKAMFANAYTSQNYKKKTATATPLSFRTLAHNPATCLQHSLLKANDPRKSGELLSRSVLCRVNTLTDKISPDLSYENML